VSTHRADHVVSRIRRAQAGITAAEQELNAARDQGSVREVGRLERELANRRAYLAELLATARGLVRR
jgi:hypothetical protein